MVALSTRYALVVIIAGLTMVSSECPKSKGDSKPYSLEWKIMIADVVVHGVAVSVEPDRETKTSTVVFEIMCIYKGGPLVETIRIIQVGYNPANCLTTEMTKGTKYMLYLMKTDKGTFYQEFKPDIIDDDSQFLDEIVVMCDVTVKYAIGYNETYNKETCPDEYSYADCIAKPVLANPPYTDDGAEQSAFGETTNQPQKDGEKKENGVAGKSKETPEFEAADGNNGCVTLTLHLSALTCLLLATVLAL